MPKTIRATITVEVPYSNELMNYGDKLDKQLRAVIDNTKLLNCKLEAGEHTDNTMPIIRDNTDETKL